MSIRVDLRLRLRDACLFAAPELHATRKAHLMAVESYLDNEERQRLVSQYAEIATLAGGLAHEIKNPLSTIGMNLELMAEQFEQAESPRDRRMLQRIQTIQRECRQLEEVLNAFLQFARVGELVLEPCDLNQLVREFIDFYAAQAAEQGIEISPHLDPNVPAIPLDRSLMRQVLMNLALNAQQAMPDGGLIELQTYLAPPSPPGERRGSFPPSATEADGGRVCLAMIDNGLGMDEPTRAKMFQAFFSTKSSGSGLGLPTVRKIVEAHNGTISCESERGRGTRFTITLPLADPNDLQRG